MCLEIFKYFLISKYLAILKYIIISKWQFSLTLASLFFLIDYQSVKLISENVIKVEEDHKYLIFIQNLPKAFFDLFQATQKVKFLPNNNALLKKKL